MIEGRRRIIQRPRYDATVKRWWPILACTMWMPIMFLLGLQGVIWAVPAIVLGARVVLGKNQRIPTTAGWLLLFLVWAGASTIQIRFGYLPLFIYRWLLFAGVLACEVTITNEPTSSLPTERITRWMAALWIVTITFGWFAVIVPPIQIASPFLRVLPGALKSNEFIKTISEWRLAETQGFLGFPVPRPSAPFPDANGWGAAIGLTTPFFIRAWLVDVPRRRRTLGLVMFAVALVPIVISLNRGLWIALSVMIAYLALRRAIEGDLRMVGVAIGVVVLVTVLFFVTPAGNLITARINAAGDSNQARSSVYKDAFQGALGSPLLGAGAPKKVPGSANPPVGTHGLIWYLLFVHGFIATGLFIAWLACELWKSAPSRAPNSIYFHLVIVIACVQFAYYGMLPQIVIVGIAAGLARREAANARSGRSRHAVAPLPEPSSPEPTLLDVS